MEISTQLWPLNWYFHSSFPKPVWSTTVCTWVSGGSPAKSSLYGFRGYNVFFFFFFFFFFHVPNLKRCTEFKFWWCTSVTVEDFEICVNTENCHFWSKIYLFKMFLCLSGFFPLLYLFDLNILRVRAVVHKTVRVCHVYCNFKIGFTCRITVIFGTLKDGSLLINALASNICFSYRNMFQNGVDALTKIVDAFLSKSLKSYLVRIIR